MKQLSLLAVEREDPRHLTGGNNLIKCGALKYREEDGRDLGHSAARAGKGFYSF